jgi:branched-chain amino acid aminotransferase
VIQAVQRRRPEDEMTEPDAAGTLWPAGAAWLDGRYCPVEEAKISVLDLGVTRSGCTYDVVHVWRGRFYRLDAHLDRFAASLARLRLDPGHDRAAFEAVLHGCVGRTGLREAEISALVPFEACQPARRSHAHRCPFPLRFSITK